MEKLLIIPDVHGRGFWKNIVNNTWDKIIFLGDYLDPYSGEVTKKEAISNFREIIDFKNNNKDNIILLLGNHDIPYYSKDYFIEYLCRYDYQNYKEIEELFKQTEFQYTYLRKGQNYIYDVLLSHAGVTQKWFNQIGNPKNLEDYCINNVQALAQCSYHRGGLDSCGSIIWADVLEHLPNPDFNIFQIFGHTYSKFPIIAKHFAMLDTGNKETYALLEGNLLQISINNEHLSYYIDYGKRDRT